MKVLDIIDYGNNGEGIAKDNGKVYFVPKTIVGEKVEVDVIKEKSNDSAKRLSCESISPDSMESSRYAYNCNTA